MPEFHAPLSWADLWADATTRLGNSDEARMIIEQASGRSGASWLMRSDTQAPSGSANRVHAMVDRRLAGEPLQYVLGSWGFRTLQLRIDRRVLIPRPETEQVAEAALQILKSVPSPLVADLGTGSGAIALSIAVEHSGALVYATDLSADALEVAEVNLDSLPPIAQERVMLCEGSWFDALPGDARGKLDLIISNPPYIGELERPDIDEQVVEWEPASALFSGPEGLDDIEHIVTEAREWLKPHGTVIVELAPHQAERVAQLARSRGYSRIAIGEDLARRPRFLAAAT